MSTALRARPSGYPSKGAVTTLAYAGAVTGSGRDPTKTEFTVILASYSHVVSWTSDVTPAGIAEAQATGRASEDGGAVVMAIP